MSFLAPLFFVGLAAIGIPILVHLIQRERKEVIHFPSLMFLRKIPYQSVERRRIHNWWLLALRAAAMLLLVSAFSRPFLTHADEKSAAATTGAREVVILLDRSASMGYGDHWTRAKAEADLQEANPVAPWMWRPDWAERRAKSENPGKAATAWFFCIVWNLLSVPAAIAAVPQMLRTGDLRMLFVLIFPAVGVVALVFAIRASLRDRRFGDTYFQFDSVPFSPGSPVRGAIHLRFEADAPQGIDLRLACIRRTVTGTGKNRSVTESVLWQTDRNIPSSSLGADPVGRTIPVDFALPADVLVTAGDIPSERVLWRLHAQADIPGINYSDDFEIPVFRTSLSSATQAVDAQQLPSSSGSTDGFGFPSVAVGASDSGPVSAPTQPKVRISPQTGGTEFFFPALRTPARDLGLFVFTVVWSGIVYFLATRASIPFAVVFGLFDLLLIAGLFHSVFGSARVLVNSAEIAWRREMFGLGRTRTVPVSEIQSLVAVSGGQQSGTRENVLYSIRLRTKDGRRITLADEIDTRQEARWIVSQMESCAGLQLDTHVEADLPLGVAPQPGRPPIPGGRQNPKAALAVAAFGAVFMVATFAFQWSAFRNARGRVSHAASSKAARNSAPVARRNFPSPLRDEDTARIFAMPVQDQAEELLERAIEHDEKALELFTENVGTWVSRVHKSPRMATLEQRSRFSKDLRVRYANVDINLALEGWTKSEDSVEKLIARAKPGSPYRTYGVYYLGMLGGRGVEYDRIHSLLLDYAQHDSDAAVRQWSVEGLRFLGKDEVLDELWDSFTQDPSFSVRDRAGCNISDCGLFTRAQRMRMVPQLIDLASDSSTPPQMRSWSFLALREITDENLAPDAAAWSRWFADHGAERLAQFQQADWWQIRGDE